MRLDIAVTPDVSLAFATPISVRKVQNTASLNNALERAILARRDKDGGGNHSNVGGWHSAPDLLEWPEPEVRMMLGEVDRSVQKLCALPNMMETRRAEGHPTVAYRASAWANCNENGHYNALHIHSGHQWSAVYYVTVGKPAAGHSLNGRLELRDPRPAAPFGFVPGFTFGQPLTVEPEPGLLVVFPAWLEHWVHPFYGEGHRISIAINIALEKR
jgi:uncharacterized protein (TIGR02466 family)